MYTLTLSTFLAQPHLFLLRPSGVFFWSCYLMLCLFIFLGVMWPFSMNMQHSFAGYISFVFSGVLAIVLCLPSSRDINRQINFGFDRQQIYLVNGYQSKVLAIGKNRIVRVNLSRSWGDYFTSLGFSIDVKLHTDELTQVQQLLGAIPDERLQVAPGVYRLGFSSNWRSKKHVYQALQPLVSITG